MEHVGCTKALVYPKFSHSGIDMEVWKIIIPYPKNGHQYLPLFRCRLKCPASGQWFDALIYQDYDSKHLYVREKKDFFDKFVKLNDWKNGKKNKS